MWLNQILNRGYLTGQGCTTYLLQLNVINITLYSIHAVAKKFTEFLFNVIITWSLQYWHCKMLQYAYSILTNHSTGYWDFWWIKVLMWKVQWFWPFFNYSPRCFQKTLWNHAVINTIPAFQVSDNSKGLLENCSLECSVHCFYGDLTQESHPQEVIVIHIQETHTMNGTTQRADFVVVWSTPLHKVKALTQNAIKNYWVLKGKGVFALDWKGTVAWGESSRKGCITLFQCKINFTQRSHSNNFIKHGRLPITNMMKAN